MPGGSRAEKSGIMLKLPLWAVSEHIQTVEIEQLPCSEPGKTAVFTTSARLFAFLNAHIRGEWKIAMAGDRDGLIVMIADFHRADIRTIIVDPGDRRLWRPRSATDRIPGASGRIEKSGPIGPPIQ
jgi:hypothetical protein